MKNNFFAIVLVVASIVVIWTVAPTSGRFVSSLTTVPVRTTGSLPRITWKNRAAKLALAVP